MKEVRPELPGPDAAAEAARIALGDAAEVVEARAAAFRPTMEVPIPRPTPSRSTWSTP